MLLTMVVVAHKVKPGTQLPDALAQPHAQPLVKSGMTPKESVDVTLKLVRLGMPSMKHVSVQESMPILVPIFQPIKTVWNGSQVSQEISAHA